MSKSDTAPMPQTFISKTARAAKSSSFSCRKIARGFPSRGRGVRFQKNRRTEMGMNEILESHQVAKASWSAIG
jgi:hypothetical protein